MPQGFFTSLKVAASSPYALIAYVLLLAAWVYVVVSRNRLSYVRSIIKDVPQADRLKTIEAHLRTTPKGGLTAEQWLASRLRDLIFLAFLSLLVAILIVAVLALTLYAQNNKTSQKEHFRDSNKEACMNNADLATAEVGCRDYAITVRAGCPSYAGNPDPVCIRKAQCWEDKSRMMQVINFACSNPKYAGACEQQKRDAAVRLIRNCDEDY